MPSLPRWPSRRKANKRKPRDSANCFAEGEPAPKRKCSTRSKVKGVFTSGASAALIKKGFPDHSGVVISETAPIPEDLLNVSLEEVIFSAEWVPEVILQDPFTAFDSSQDDTQEITPERTPEKVLEPEKEKLRTPEKVLEPEREKTPRTRAEKLATVRSLCPRSSTPGRPRKRKATMKRHRVRTQDMIEEGLRFLDESDSESIEDGCLLLGLTRDVIDLD